MTPRPAPTVPVVCCVCRRRMQGHPTVTGRYAVSRHRDKTTGRRCTGFFVFALPVHVRQAIA